MFLCEILQKHKTAYVTLDAFFPRHKSEIWIDLFSDATIQPDTKFNCLVRYAETPGVYAEIASTSHIDAIKQGLGYDLVGYHLNLQPGSFLPVLMGCAESDEN